MNRKQQGFSLMEIMLIMVIVITLSAGGLYGWQQWQQQQRLWQATQQLRGYLEQLRSDANWHNRDHLLWIKKAGAGWCLGSKSLSEQQCDPASRTQFVQPFADIELVSMTEGLGFYGIRNTAWPGHITLRSPVGSWRIILSAWGRIRSCNLSGAMSCE